MKNKDYEHEAVFHNKGVKEINEMLDQFVSDNVARREIKKLLEDRVMVAATNGFKAGWTRSEIVNGKVNQIISKNK